jgi:hypothetical protein
MTSDPAAPVPNPAQHRDAGVLIGMLAVFEGAIWAGDVDEHTAGKVAERFVQEGLLAADYCQRDLRQARLPSLSETAMVRVCPAQVRSRAIFCPQTTTTR